MVMPAHACRRRPVTAGMHVFFRLAYRLNFLPESDHVRVVRDPRQAQRPQRPGADDSEYLTAGGAGGVTRWPQNAGLTRAPPRLANAKPSTESTSG